MILKILTFPDPILRKKAQAVTKVTPELKALAENMVETMYSSRGIGLAAPQIGELVRLLVLDTRPRDEDGNIVLEEMTELERLIPQPLIIFNPELLKTEGKTTFEEGCLSVPTYFETVTRPEYIEARGLDVDGREIFFKTDGLLAICLQHEMDHLEGKLFIDRLSVIKSNRIKSKIKKFGYVVSEKSEEEEEVEHSLI
jgi:peptide deformylase